jgi:DNA-binding ferritin-like protein
MISQISIQLRAMHLYYHMCHNMVKGSLFNQDHSTFASFYDQCDSDYDSAIERAINKEGEKSACLAEQMKEVFKIIKPLPCCEVKENKEFYKAGLDLEVKLCKMIDDCIKFGVSSGTEQVIGNIADKSEVRQYLIQRRLS